MPNLVNVQQYISAGFARLDFHLIDNKGLPAGISGIVTPGAQGVGAGRIRAAKTMNINVPKPDVVPITGDNAPDGTFIFPSAAVRSFDVAFAEDDFQDRLAFQNINPQNIGNFSFSGRDILPFVINNVMLIGVSNASSKKQSVSGLGMYAGVFATRCQMTVQGRTTFAERAAAEYMATVALNPMDAYPWGQTFSSATGKEGYTQSFIEDWTLAYPATCHRYTQAAAETTYFLSETPASSSVDDMLIFDVGPDGNFTRLTNVTITPATKQWVNNGTVVTVGHDLVVWYGYLPS